MDNDSGRGSRSNEPPKLANVRRLHLDDADGSNATSHRGVVRDRAPDRADHRRARPATPPINRPASTQNETPVVLDWRHAEASPPPTALERLGRSLHPPKSPSSTRPPIRSAETRSANTSEPTSNARRRQHSIASAGCSPTRRAGGAGHRQWTAERSADRSSGASDETPQRPKRQSAPHQPDRPRFRTWAPLHKVLQGVVASRPQNSIPRGIAKVKSKTQSLNLRSAIPGVRQATIVLGIAALS